jgi:hypothetical protein
MLENPYHPTNLSDRFTCDFIVSIEILHFLLNRLNENFFTSFQDHGGQHTGAHLVSPNKVNLTELEFLNNLWGLGTYRNSRNRNSRNRVIVPARPATYSGGIHSLESIPGLHKRLKIRAQFSGFALNLLLSSSGSS